MINGRIFDSMSMDEVYPTAKKRGPFWFEMPGSETWGGAAAAAVAAHDED